MPSWKSLSLRARLLLLVALAVLPALGLLTYPALVRRKGAEKEARAEAQRLVWRAAATENRVIEDVHQLLGTLARRAEFQHPDPARILPLFADIVQGDSLYRGLSLIAIDGTVLASSAPRPWPATVARVPEFEQALKAREFWGSGYAVSPFSRRPTVIFTIPVFGPDGAVKNLLIAAIRLERLQHINADVPLPTGATLTIFDRVGTVVVRVPHDDGWIGRSARGTEIGGAVLERQEGAAAMVGLDHVARDYAFTPIRGTRDPSLFVAVGVSKHAALAAADQAYRQSMIAMLFVAALALAAAWFGSEVVVLRRLRALMQAARKIGAGDLEVRAGAGSGKSELDELGREFDAMAARLAVRRSERDLAEAALRELNRDLERRVEERTRDLELGNRELSFEVQERARIEALLGESRQELRDYIDQMSTFNAKVAPDGTILLVNRAAELASGLPRDELMRTNFLEGTWWSFDPEVHARVKAAFARAVAGEPQNYDERIFVFGQALIINFSLVPVRDASGAVAYLVAEGRDITAMKRLEEALQQRTTELETANKELEGFSYSVSHDLRAPLRAIDGFARILVDHHARELSPDAQRHLHRVREGAQKMGQLIDDLLSFSRSGRQPLERRPVAPTMLVREVLAELRGDREGRQIELEVKDLPPCEADPALLKQVYVNLLSNAIKYTRRRDIAHIEVGSRTTDGQQGEIVYYVKDNGVGFDMRYAGRLFGVFQRLHRAEDFEGTGVGLAIAQRVVYRHGGRIWAESAPDQGATFYFTLGSPGGAT